MRKTEEGGMRFLIWRWFALLVMPQPFAAAELGLTRV